MGNRQAQRRQNRDAIRAAIEASMSEAPLPVGWEKIMTNKGLIYYVDHINQMTTLDDPRMGLKKKKKRCEGIPKYKKDLYSKSQNIISRIHLKQQDEGQIEINVSREKLFDDSYHFISTLDAFTLTRRLFVKFDGEEGLDYGGMSREWFLSLSEEIFNDERKLFKRSSDGRFVKINRFSHMEEDYLKKFHFVGLIMGMAIYHTKIIYPFFSLPFYKSLLGRKLELSDLKYEEPSVYKSLQQMLEADDVTDWDLDFTYNAKDENDKDTVILLKEGGDTISLNNENREEFVALVLKYYFNSTEKQMTALKEGFQLFVPIDMLEDFEPEELELLLCGNLEVDLNDLKENTEYGEGLGEHTPVIRLFWEILATLTQEELKNFLRFTTGSNKVPVGGFAHLYGSNGPQKFKIVLKTVAGLPTAHSCFNRLELANYTDKEKLTRDLVLAITETSGFGLE